MVCYSITRDESEFVRSCENIFHIRLSDLRRASEWSRTGDCVASRDRPVQLELNPGVSRFVYTWKADGRRTGIATSCHVDLSTLHVQLSTGVVRGGVESDELSAEEVPGNYRVSRRYRFTKKLEMTYCPLEMHDGSTKSTRPLLLYSLVTAHSPLASMPSS